MLTNNGTYDIIYSVTRRWANKARKLVKELIEGGEENDKIHKDNVNSK